MQAWWAVDKCSGGAEGTTTRQALLLEKRDDDGFDAPSGVRDGERRRQAGWATNAALGGKLWRRGLRRLPC